MNTRIGFALALLGPLAHASVVAAPKNIVVVLADDLGWRDLGHSGSKSYETPRIDALAGESFRFTQAYTAHPRCVPARWALMTGRFPARGGVPERSHNMDPQEFTVAEALKEAGYATFFAGKWHLAKRPDQMPEAQGFDINFAGGHAGAPASYFWPYDEAKSKGGGKESPLNIAEGSEGEYLTDRLTDETIAFLRRHRSEHPEQPFFVYLSHYAVHTPLEAKPDLLARAKDRLSGMTFEGPEFLEVDGETKHHQNHPVYAAMLASLDQSVGRVLDTLDELGLAENTVVVFTSDHGGLSNRGAGNGREVATSNLPLRAGKGHCYEGGIRVPLLIRWPGLHRPGSTSDTPVVGTDLYPTLLRAAGLPLRPEQHKDGQDLSPLLREEPFERSGPLFWYSPRARPRNTGDRNCAVIRVGDLKLFDFFDDQRVELYDLSRDPFEQTNLAGARPDDREALLRTLRAWRFEVSTADQP